jgi:hypothetical protein
MSTLTEGKYFPDFIKYEQDQNVSRETATIKAGSGSTRPLTAGMVLAKLTTATAATAAKSGGNTGTGTITMDATIPVKTGVKLGVYTVRFAVAATNNGTFIVTDPDGREIGTVVMAAGAGTFAGPIKFAIADGGTDFVVGDGFDVTITAIVEKWLQLAPSGTDGSEKAAGILYADITAADGTDKTGAVVIVRNAIYLSDQLTWPSGITTAQKAAAQAQLKNLGLLAGVAG